MNTCLKCNNETKNKKFCSRSCSVSHNNKVPKRKAATKHCAHCDIVLNPDGRECRLTVCKNCNKNHVDWSTVTYRNITDKRIYQVHSRIRNVARRIYNKSNLPKCCVVCGHDKHYEVCHIKPISEHAPDDTVAIINDLRNLVALCPNHHWELDYGDLSIQDIITMKVSPNLSTYTS
jgi:hypothetical protein